MVGLFEDLPAERGLERAAAADDVLGQLVLVVGGEVAAKLGHVGFAQGWKREICCT